MPRLILPPVVPPPDNEPMDRPSPLSASEADALLAIVTAEADRFDAPVYCDKVPDAIDIVPAFDALFVRYIVLAPVFVSVYPFKFRAATPYPLAI